MHIAIYVGEKMVQILLPDQAGVIVTVLSDGDPGAVCREKKEIILPNRKIHCFSWLQCEMFSY